MSVTNQNDSGRSLLRLVVWSGVISGILIPVSARAAFITNAGTAILNAGNGSVVVTGGGMSSGCIDWYNTTAPSCPQAAGTTAAFSVNGGSTSPFASGETGAIKDINFNTSFPVVDFITIVTPSGIAHFDLADLRVNLGPDIGSCTQASGDTHSGVSCTPTNSPFQLLNGIADQNGVVNTVTISLTIDAYGYLGTSGTNYNAANRYIGVFSTQSSVNGNIDSILAAIQGGQGVSASWSATLSPSAAAPEPATYGTLGMSLIGLGYLLRRRNRQQV
jgi:hypothetical protein